jgi:hypothetical protein
MDSEKKRKRKVGVRSKPLRSDERKKICFSKSARTQSLSMLDNNRRCTLLFVKSNLFWHWLPPPVVGSQSFIVWFYCGNFCCWMMFFISTSLTRVVRTLFPFQRLNQSFFTFNLFLSLKQVQTLCAVLWFHLIGTTVSFRLRVVGLLAKKNVHWKKINGNVVENSWENSIHSIVKRRGSVHFNWEMITVQL